MVCMLMSLGWCLSPWGRALDIFCYDFFFLLRGTKAPTEDIVIVAIDEPSFGNIGFQWPWPRSVHAALIDALFSAGARTVAFDVLFSEPSLSDEDAVFREAIARHPSLVLAADIDLVNDRAYSQEMIVKPHPSLIDGQTLLGYIYLPLDPDGFIRSSRMGGSSRESLSRVAARQFLGPDLQNRLGSGERINFAGPHRTIKTISYYQALSPGDHLPDDLLKNKLVFVGFSTQNVSDIHLTRPDHFPTPFTRWGDGYMSGVEVHANLSANAISHQFINVFPTTGVILVSLMVCMLTGILFFHWKPVPGALILVLFWLFTGISAFILFNRNFLYLPFIYICLPMTSLYLVSPFFHYIEGRRERNYIRQVFSTYVAPSVVRQLIENPGRLELGGEERPITAFFSDVEGFSGISEMLTPTELVGLLNEFLTEMTDIILEHRGTVDKFEGDAIIAMFGAPNQLPDHAEQACLACINMQNRLAVLRESWKDRGLPALKMRVGLCSGPAVVGNMGSKRRMDYTMMGDTVNTASRLEGANKIYQTYTLICESTRRAAGEAVIFREVDTISVVGKKEALRAYEIIGIPGQLDDGTRLMINRYEQGLNAYRQREWHRAADCFEQALISRPDDGPSRILLNRCREFEICEPDKTWDGAHKMETK